MTIYNPSQLDIAFRALGDGTRRAIVEQLGTVHERTANNLVVLFESSQPTISKHLKVLEEAGLIQRRIEGRNHYFSMRPQCFAELEQWIGRHGAFWDRSLDRLAQHLADKDDTQ